METYEKIYQQMMDSEEISVKRLTQIINQNKAQMYMSPRQYEEKKIIDEAKVM